MGEILVVVMNVRIGDMGYGDKTRRDQEKKLRIGTNRMIG